MDTDRYTVDPSVRVLLADLGVSPADVLRRAGLPSDLFSRGQVSLPPGEYHALWRAVEDEYAGEHLPIAVARALSVEIFHPSIFAAICSANLSVAARRIATYKRLVGPMRLLVEESPEATRLEMRWPRGVVPPQALAATELLFWVALTRIATRAPVRPRHVGMPDPPGGAAAYEEFLGCRVRKDPAYVVSFSALDAARPFLTANESMWERFEPSLRSHLSELEAGSSTAQRVRAALLELLPAGNATMQAVARDLSVSTRTLQRRLHEEATSFQAVLNEVREELARHYLADPSMSVATIAFLLGYQDQSSFYRAFSSWTGHTPDLLRTRAG